MTIQTLRPNGDVLSNAPFSISGASTRWQAVSDNSDSSFVVGTVQQGYFRVSLGNLTPLAAGQRVKSVTVRQRNSHSAAGGGTQTMHNIMYDDTNTSLGSVGSSYFTRGTTAATTFTGNPAYAAPGGRAWSEGIVNFIGLQTSYFLANDGSGTFGRVYELYVDVDINSQPIVSGTPTVTTTANNAQPTVNWVYEDDDGDPQKAWRVKIFDSATYGSSNFDADKSIPVWDSGQNTGADVSVIVGADNKSYLFSGVTYKAFVKVAQDWPGPQGRLWFSSWKSSNSFSVTYTIPYTPTITASLLQDKHAYQSLLTVTAPINLLTNDNASFEATIGTWVADTNMSAPVRSTVNPLDGSADMLLNSTASGTMIAKCNLVGDTPTVKPGIQYTALASFRTLVSARSCAVGVRWLNAAGGTISTQFGSTVSDSTGGYTQATFTGNAPALAVNALVVVEVLSTGAANEQHRVDQVSLSVGNSTSWTPGGYTGTQDIIVERGEFLDNNRGPAVNWAHIQIASGGSETMNPFDGFNSPPSDSFTWQYCNQVIPDGYTPPGMIRWFTQTAATNNVGFGGSNYSDTTQWRFPVIAGQAHIFSFWAWTESGTFTGTPRILWKNSSESTIQTDTGTQITLTTTPQRVSFSSTAPAGAVFGAANFTNDNSTTGNGILITRVGWGLGTIPVDGFISRNPAGVQWYIVRNINDGAFNNQDDTVGSDTAQTIFEHDVELPVLRPVLYRARQQTTLNGSLITSANSTYVTLYGTAPAVTILRSVAKPILSLSVNRRMQTSLNFSEDASIYHPLGADGAPVKIRDWISGEDGQLIVITSTEAQNARLRSVMLDSGVYVILWHQGGRAYVLLSGWDISETLTEKTWCDIDGYTNVDLRNDVYSLTYLETSTP